MTAAPVGIRRAFVTGATGAIGSALTERLSREGWQVAALARRSENAVHFRALRGVEVVVGDLDDHATLAEACRHRDVVFHLAALVHAPAGTPEREFHHVNVEGTRSLLDAAVRGGAKRFVLFSSVAVYADTSAVMDEGSATLPQTPYGRSKLAAERAAGGRRGEIEVTILRLPVVYGRRDRGNVMHLVRAIDRGRFAIVGSGENLKTMVGLDNVVDATLIAAVDPRAAAKTYIVSDARDYTQAEIAATIADLLGKSRRVPKIPRLPMLALGHLADAVSAVVRTSFVFTADRIRKVSASAQFSGDCFRRELGFVPRQTLRDGLVPVIAELREDRASFAEQELDRKPRAK
ncbi:MAG: SDR family NAD(P)-dependent oxidoreductase [Gemmatimonadaceae bacterium]|nr:SDR family NAD(P)-dependent oxidoreductase [Gemmatimonadaceae bacterium]